jgi:hypothetical protein
MLEYGRIYSFYQLLAFLGEMWGTGQYDMVATNLSLSLSNIAASFQYTREDLSVHAQLY